MARVEGVSGVREIIRGLRKAKAKKTKQLRNGLIEAGRFLQRESQLIVPVDRTFLKNAADTRMGPGRGLKSSVDVVYEGIDYAVYVHEIQATHKPGKRWKFLEEPARTKRHQIRQIIKDAVDGK